MRRLSAAILAAGLSLGIANAADMPVKARAVAPPALYNWSGIYVGANAGGAWAHECWTNLPPLFLPPTGDEGCHTGSGFAAGGQIGINFQNGTWVYGLEALGDWASLKGSNVNAIFGGPTIDETKVNAFGTFVGRFGYAMNNVLIFVNGGAAWNTANRNETVVGFNLASQDTWRWGWTVGGGFEYGLTPNWSAGIDYQYMRFNGTVEISCPPCILGQNPLHESIPQNIHAVMARLNYRFGMP